MAVLEKGPGQSRGNQLDREASDSGRLTTDKRNIRNNGFHNRFKDKREELFYEKTIMEANG